MGFLVFKVLFIKSMLTRLNPTYKRALNNIIKIEQSKNVKKIPQTGSKSFSSIIPNIMVGIIIKIEQIRNFKYLGF